MARHLRFAGLASIVVVERDDEVDALLDHPDLDRTYAVAGPVLNRLMSSTLRHALFRDGRALLSFCPREDSERAAAQSALAKRLDALAQRSPWADDAMAAMAAYVVNGTDREAALAALTYATAYPFLAPDDAQEPLPFEPSRFRHLFELYQRLRLARNRVKGLPYRLLGADKRAAREILQITGGDDYGLHAVGITLDNSVLILEHLRAAFTNRLPNKAEAPPFDWNRVRTAPAAVTRQNSVPCKVPGIPDEVPSNSLFLLKMRQALRPGSPAGFEFAGTHWSYCPAAQYIAAIFARVSDTSERLHASA